MRSLINFSRRLYSHRSLILAMALREMRNRYAGTLAGMIWSIVHPLMMILIYWLVFSVGFKVQPSGGTPFIVYFLCGLIPWTMFAETVTASTHAVTGNPHLVTKTVFSTEILPFVHLTASAVSHVIMLTILIIVMAATSIPFSPYNFQLIYYLAGLAVFCVGLGWIVSALNVFYRDVGQILSVILNMWFWLTPIVWPFSLLSERGRVFEIIGKLNPMYYVVHGYRASFIPDFYAGFWQDAKVGIYFWAVSLAMFAAGGLLFRRLKPDFPEVL